MHNHSHLVVIYDTAHTWFNIALLSLLACHCLLSRDATKVQLQAAAAARANGVLKEAPVCNGSAAAAGQATW
jgi:hypothetical protein